MQNWIENTDLNINSWLITWGYLNGYLQDGQIQPTKYNIIYQWIVIIILAINAIRFGILLSNPKGSLICYQLGDWGYFLGPRVIINGIIFLAFSYMLMLMAFFKFCARNSQKMFYWLNIMDYDYETRCYFNMNLDESDSKTFTKQSLIFINALKCFIAVCIPFFTTVISISILINMNDYYLNKFISSLIFIFIIYHGVACCYGLPIILYLVSINLVNEIFNHFYVCF